MWGISQTMIYIWSVGNLKALKYYYYAMVYNIPNFLLEMFSSNFKFYLWKLKILEEENCPFSISGIFTSKMKLYYE